MKKIGSLFLVLLGLSVCEGQKLSGIEELRSAIEKAQVATFYSAAFSNGRGELELAERYADSARAIMTELDSIPDKMRSTLLGIEKEHEASRSIAEENLNFRYPTASIMCGYREDFVVKDDPDELLVEALVEKTLEQNDPLNKGKIRDNMDYVVLHVTPFDQSLFHVSLDFLTTQTGHYTIRYHEYASILGSEGLERFEAGEMSDEDWMKMFTHFKVDKMLLLDISDLGSSVDGLSYKGVNLKKVVLGSKPEFVGHFEDFRADKRSSWSEAIWVSGLNYFLLFLVLIGLLFYSEGMPILLRSKMPEHRQFIELAVLALVPLMTVLAVQVLGGRLAPDINAYYKEQGVRAWVLYQLMAPGIAATVMTYLAMFKIPGIVVNSHKSMTRILTASFMCPLVVWSFYEYHTALFPRPIYSYLLPVHLAGIYFSSSLLARLADKWMKGQMSGSKALFLAIILFIGLPVASYYQFSGEHLSATIAYASLALIGFFGAKVKDVTISDRTISDIEESISLAEPFQWFTAGTDLLESRTELLKVIRSNEDLDKPLAVVIKGDRGSGKTRLLKETLKELQEEQRKGERSAINWFEGDCNEGDDGLLTLYEPFFEAFSLNGDRFAPNGPSLPNKFFSDRSSIAKGLEKVVSQAGKGVHLDALIGSVESDTEKLSTEEIAIQLMEWLEEHCINGKMDPRIVLVLDDFHWIDERSLQLFKVFLHLIQKRKQSRVFRFILTENTSSSSLERLNVEELKIEEIPIHFKDPKTFLRDVLASNNYIHYGGVSSRLGPVLKEHIHELVKRSEFRFVPKMLFSYLGSIEQRGCITINEGWIRMVSTPPADLDITNGYNDIYEAQLRALTEPQRALLESAAVVGYKFDADILAGVWKRDVMGVIRELSVLEDGFVRDLNDEDNIYAFENRSIFKTVLNSARNKGGDENRQLIIEYQKRVVKMLLEKEGEKNMNVVDLDILRSASYRCIQFAHVPFISENLSEVVLQTAHRLARKGLATECADLLEQLCKKVRSFSSEELASIAQIVEELTHSDRSMKEWKFLLPDTEIEFVDHLMDQVLKTALAPDHSMYMDRLMVSICGSVLVEFQDIRKEGRLSELMIRDIDLATRSGVDMARFEKLRSRFIQIEQWFSKPKDESTAAYLRFQFYGLKLLKVKGIVPEMSDLLQTCLSAEHYDLAGEIARDITLQREAAETRKGKRPFIITSLLILNGQPKPDRIADGASEWSRVPELIEEIMLRDFSHGQKTFWSNVNFTISRLREIVFEEERNWHWVIELCDHAQKLSDEMNDPRGIELAMSYRAAAYFHLKEYGHSFELSKKYLDFLIGRRTPLKYCSFAFEGIYRNTYQMQRPFEKEMQQYQQFFLNEENSFDETLRDWIQGWSKGGEGYSLYVRSEQNSK